MKRFLKKANRGLLLGAFALIALIIYVVVDYISFDSEKPKIKETVENYIGGFYEVMEKDDFDELETFIKDAWTSELVMYDGYYEDKESMMTLFDNIKSQKLYTEYGDITFSMSKLSVKKSGPNMACVNLEFTSSVEYGCSSELIEPFSPYLSCWYYSEDTNDKRYVYETDFEGELYLRKEDGEWKIAQANVYSMICIQREKEGQ